MRYAKPVQSAGEVKCFGFIVYHGGGGGCSKFVFNL